MSNISIRNIAQEGHLYHEDERIMIYLTPSQPLKYDTNKWVYKEMPTIEQWHKDMTTQYELHEKQHSNHLAFTFPENERLEEVWKNAIEKEGFQLGLLEFYIIEGNELTRFPSRKDVVIEEVNESNMEDYLNIYYSFALPYGKPFAIESVNDTRRTIQHKKDNICRLIAYVDKAPVGTVDVIETEETIEIDSFGVMENYRRQGVGSTLQAHIGSIANERPVILVADGEDTAKDMYTKQGYTYQSFVYHIIKEDVK